MNFAEEMTLTRKGIYFRMLDDLEALKTRGLELLDIYFIYQEKDQPEDKIVFKIVTEQMEQTSKKLKSLEAKIIDFTQERFSKSELEAMKIEYSLR
jgi:hypothetical protein